MGRGIRVGLLATAWLLWTCGAIWLATGAIAQGAQRADGEIVDFTYKPLQTTVDVGTTITWVNHGSRPHTVTDRGGTFDTRPINPNKSGKVTFTVPGTYQYFCRINPAKMNGVIVVRPGATPARVNRIQAVDPALPGEKLRFDPPTLEVQTGSTLLFANVGGKPHTLTADDGSFDTGVVTPGAEGGRFAGTNATLTLSKPGRFPFHCEIHPKAMRGVLTVSGGEAGAPAAASNAPQQANVSVKDFEFDKPEVSVAPGGKVTWQNTGAVPHTATFDDVQLDTQPIQPGKRAVLTAPTRPGSYSYKCAIHPARMRGVLVVVGQNAADPTQQAAAPPAAAGAPPVAAASPSRAGLSWLALVTGVLGAFAGGFGISAFVRGRPRHASGGA
jgi:plastocyanin